MNLVLATLDLTKKHQVSSSSRLKVMDAEVPKFKKVGHVTLATPTYGLFIIHRPLCSTRHGQSNKENTKSLASSIQKLWRGPTI